MLTECCPAADLAGTCQSFPYLSLEFVNRLGTVQGVCFADDLPSPNTELVAVPGLKSELRASSKRKDKMLRLRRRTKKDISLFLVLFVAAMVLYWSMISILDVIS